MTKRTPDEQELADRRKIERLQNQVEELESELEDLRERPECDQYSDDELVPYARELLAKKLPGFLDLFPYDQYQLAEEILTELLREHRSL